MRVSLKEYLAENRSVKSIREINDKYDYEDTYPQGKGDGPKVSCGQCDSYNELQYIFDTHLQSEIDKKVITEQQALDALDNACASIDNPRDRNDFYEFLNSELGISIPIKK